MRYLKTVLFISLLSLFLLLITSCSKKSVYPVITEVIDGVKVITNPDYPRDGRFKLTLVEELSIGAEDEDENYILNRPFDLKVDADGNIYVLDWGDIQIRVYDYQGRYVRTIGQKGQGPGEFDRPAYFDVSSDNKIYLMDSRNRRIQILDTNGSFLNSFRFEGFHSDMKTDAQNRLYFMKYSRTQKPDVLNKFVALDVVKSVYRTDYTGKELFHVADLKGEKSVVKSLGEKGAISLGGRHVIVWTVNKDGKLLAGYNENYKLNVYSPNGELEFSFGREYTPINSKYYRGESWQKKYMPAFKDRLLIDEDDKIWLELYTDDDTKEIIYDVFSPEGIYERQISTEHRIFQFKNGKAYCIVRTEEEYYAVKRFSLLEKSIEE